MFNKEISLFYRFICLILYILVIIFTNNTITPFILLFFFFIGTRCFSDYVYVLLYLLSLISLIVYFSLDSGVLLRIVLVLSYIVYFFNTTNLGKLINLKDKRKDKTEISEYDYTHFKSKEDVSHSDLALVYYMTLHLGILFIAVLVGR